MTRLHTIIERERERGGENLNLYVRVETTELNFVKVIEILKSNLVGQEAYDRSSGALREAFGRKLASPSEDITLKC